MDRNLKTLREKYPKGTRVRLSLMKGENLEPDYHESYAIAEVLGKEDLDDDY